MFDCGTNSDNSWTGQSHSHNRLDTRSRAGVHCTASTTGHKLLVTLSHSYISFRQQPQCMCSHSSPAGRTCQSCYAMPPQSQFQTQVASSLAVVVHRVARVALPLAPRSVATGNPSERTPVHQHASLIIARPRQTSHNSLCYRFRIMSTNGHQGPQVLIFSPAVYTACVVLSVDSTHRGSHAAGGDVLQWEITRPTRPMSRQ